MSEDVLFTWVECLPKIAHFTENLVPVGVTFQQNFHRTSDASFTWPFEEEYIGQTTWSIQGEAAIRSAIMNWGLENGYNESDIDRALRFPNYCFTLLSEYFVWRVANREWSFGRTNKASQAVSVQVTWSKPKLVQDLSSMTKAQLIYFIESLQRLHPLRTPGQILLRRAKKAEVLDLAESYCHFIEEKWPLNCRDCGLPLRRYGGMTVSGQPPGTCDGQHRIWNRTQVRGTSPDSSGKWVVPRKTKQRISMRTKGVPSNEEKSP